MNKSATAKQLVGEILSMKKSGAQRPDSSLDYMIEGDVNLNTNRRIKWCSPNRA